MFKYRFVYYKDSKMYVARGYVKANSSFEAKSKVLSFYPNFNYESIDVYEREDVVETEHCTL